MSSNEESLKDAKSLHKTSVSDEVVIKFDHVTKTYNLYKNDRGRFLGIFNYNRKGSIFGKRRCEQGPVVRDQERRGCGLSRP